MDDNLEKIELPKSKGKEASIIEVIQNMVKEGQSEDVIIKNLKELGVEPEKAKRLLLLGQADTFALLRSEISKIAQYYVSDSLPELSEKINELSKEKKTELKQELTADFLKELEKFELKTKNELGIEEAKIINEISSYKKELESIGKIKEDFYKTSEKVKKDSAESLKKAEDELNSIKKSRESIIFELEKIKKDIEYVNSLRETSKSELSKASNEIYEKISQLRKEIEETKKIKDSISDEVEKTGNELKEKIDYDLSQKQKEINSKIESLKKEVEKTQNIKESIYKQISEAEATLKEKMAADIAKAKQELGGNLSGIQNEIASLNTLKNQISQDTASIKKEMSDIRKTEAPIREEFSKIDSTLQEMKKTKENFSKDSEKIKETLIAENKDFRDGIAEDVQKTLNVTEKFRDNLNELNLKTGEIQADMEELRLGGIGIRNKLISIILIFGGIFFCMAAAYLFFIRFSANLSIDAMIFTIITALIGITMLFVATIV